MIISFFSFYLYCYSCTCFYCYYSFTWWGKKTHSGRSAFDSIAFWLWSAIVSPVWKLGPRDPEAIIRTVVVCPSIFEIVSLRYGQRRRLFGGGWRGEWDTKQGRGNPFSQPYYAKYKVLFSSMPVWLTHNNTDPPLFAVPKYYILYTNRCPSWFDRK